MPNKILFSASLQEFRPVIWYGQPIYSRYSQLKAVLLENLGESKAHDTFRKEIAWREFYADVLFNNPMTDREYYAPRFADMRYDEPGAQFKAWCEGKTGYPFVDAAMA